MVRDCDAHMQHLLVHNREHRINKVNCDNFTPARILSIKLNSSHILSQEMINIETTLHRIITGSTGG